MKKRIYLFCNHQYGKAYFEVFQAALDRLENFECYVVFSVQKGGWWRRLLRMIHRPFRYSQYRRLKIFGNNFKIIEAVNVNKSGFYEAIPVGSIGFVAGFGQIFRAPLIDRFSSFINFHPSILPYYRGAIPSYWVIKNSETITGFTAHVISEKIDAGEIIYQELVDVNQGISEPELDRKISFSGSFYFDECLKSLLVGNSFRKKLVSAKYFQKAGYMSAVRE